MTWCVGRTGHPHTGIILTLTPRALTCSIFSTEKSNTDSQIQWKVSIIKVSDNQRTSLNQGEIINQTFLKVLGSRCKVIDVSALVCF